MPRVAIFPQLGNSGRGRTRYFRRHFFSSYVKLPLPEPHCGYLPASLSHFVVTCLAAMFGEVQAGENKAIFQQYMRLGDPAGALLWAVLRYR